MAAATNTAELVTTSRNQRDRVTGAATPPATARSTNPPATAKMSNTIRCRHTSVYDSVRAAYPTATSAKSAPIAAHSKSPASSSDRPRPVANRGSSSPAATGRKRLRGWRRSSSASLTSLIAYIPDASKQKDAHATITRPGVSSWPSAPAAPAAAITNAFLIHCLGRIVAMTAPGRVRRAPRRVKRPASADCMPAR